MDEQMCLECGFPIDEDNESQPVCPRCGADLAEHQDFADHPTSAISSMRFDEIPGISLQQPVITPGNNLIH